jgi:hypothetical protein
MAYDEYQFDLQLLCLLLRRTGDDIQRAALVVFIDSLEPVVRDAFVACKAVSGGGAAAQAQHSEPRYTLTKKAVDKARSLQTSKGRIVSELKKQLPFVRKAFTDSVALALGWDAPTRSFSLPTKFKTLTEADRAWWNMLKNRDRMIVDEPR